MSFIFSGRGKRRAGKNERKTDAINQEAQAKIVARTGPDQGQGQDRGQRAETNLPRPPRKRLRGRGQTRKIRIGFPRLSQRSSRKRNQRQMNSTRSGRSFRRKFQRSLLRWRRKKLPRTSIPRAPRSKYTSTWTKNPHRTETSPRRNFQTTIS